MAPPTFTPQAAAPPRPEGPETFSAYVVKNYADWISNDAALVEQMRWLPIAKRPAMGVRWGVGVTMGNVTPKTTAKTSAELMHTTGPIGPDFVRKLEQRLDEQRDGTWSPLFSDKYMKVPAFLAETEDDLVNQAAKENLDGLVLLSMSSKTMGLAKTVRYTLIVKLVDVQTKKITWTAQPLNSQKAYSTLGTNHDACVELVRDSMAKLNEQFSLTALPKIDEAAVQRRAARLADGSGSAGQALRALAELRYYQAKKLLSQEDAERTYREIASDKAKILAGGEGTERAAAVAEWYVTRSLRNPL
jgi:hypothetical protein